MTRVTITFFLIFLLFSISHCVKLICNNKPIDQPINLNFKVVPYYYVPGSGKKLISEIIAGINPRLNNVYIIIHGFQDSHNSEWVPLMIDNLHSRDRNSHVFVIDWSSAFTFSWDVWNIIDYRRAAQATELAANETSNILIKLAMKSQTLLKDWRNIHIIGHSLGAHLAGQTARKLKTDDFFVHRITALDPAFPCFEDDSATLRLKKDDAKFIDVIHTGSEKSRYNFGIFEPLGHIDFYPNGGNSQPCCKTRETRDTSIFEDAGSNIFGFNPHDLLSTFTDRGFPMVCDHIQSIVFFIQSLNSTVFWSSPSDIHNNTVTITECNENKSNCVEMGINAVNYDKRGIYYVNTESIDDCSISLPITSAFKNVLHSFCFYCGWFE